MIINFGTVNFVPPPHSTSRKRVTPYTPPPPHCKPRYIPHCLIYVQRVRENEHTHQNDSVLFQVDDVIRHLHCGGKYSRKDKGNHFTHSSRCIKLGLRSSSSRPYLKLIE